MATTTAVHTSSDGPQVIKLVNGSTVTAKSNVATTNETIPLIDVSRMYSASLADRQALAEEVRDASRNIGFFLISNHVGSSFMLDSISWLTGSGR